MKFIISASFFVAAGLLSLAVLPGQARAENDMKPDDDHHALVTCMGMSHDDMMKNPGCVETTTRLKMSSADLTMMRQCMAMPKGAAMQAVGCEPYAKSYPELMK